MTTYTEIHADVVHDAMKDRRWRTINDIAVRTGMPNAAIKPAIRSLLMEKELIKEGEKGTLRYRIA